MRMETNLSVVVSELISKLELLNDTDKLFRQAALDATALVSDRVQQDGLKTNETPIKSFYSKSYGQKRRKKGLQTQYVDLTFTGDMLDSYLPAPIIGGWAIGFTNQKQADKAEYNELNFGIVFNLSEPEIDTTLKGIIGVVDDTFR